MLARETFFEKLDELNVIECWQKIADLQKDYVKNPIGRGQKHDRGLLGRPRQKRSSCVRGVVAK